MTVLTAIFSLAAAVLAGLSAALSLRSCCGTHEAEKSGDEQVPEAAWEPAEESRLQEGIANLLAYQAGGGQKEER